MSIPKGHIVNFQTLQSAFANKDTCLAECTDKAGNPVYAICMVYEDNGEVVLVPVAKLFDGNPYDELNPPTI